MPVLDGVRVLVTRDEKEGGKLGTLLRERGAEVIELPLIRIVPPADTKPLDQAIGKLKAFHIIIFTSVNAVEHFFSRPAAQALDPKDFEWGIIFAVGPATSKALTDRGLEVQPLPREFRAEALVRLFRNVGIMGKYILIPRSSRSSNVLSDAMRSEGANVWDPVAYDNVPNDEAGPKLRELIENDGFDALLFTSGSAARNFVAMSEGLDLDAALRDKVVGCIGPATAEVARKAGFTVDCQPKEYTMEAMVDALAEHYAKGLNED